MLAIVGGDPFFSLRDVDLSVAGVVDLAELSFWFDWELPSFQGDSVLLATLSFEALAVGASQLSLLPDPVFGIDVKGTNAEILQLDVVALIASSNNGPIVGGQLLNSLDE